MGAQGHVYPAGSSEDRKGKTFLLDCTHKTFYSGLT